MPHFFFHIIDDGHRLEDEDGEDLPSMEAALAQAERIVREILEEEELGVHAIRIEIANEAAEVLAEVGTDVAPKSDKGSDRMIH